MLKQSVRVQAFQASTIHSHASCVALLRGPAKGNALLSQSPALLRVTHSPPHHPHLSHSEGDVSCLEPKHE